MSVLDYSTTAADNVTLEGVSIRGTALISSFDNSFRQLMADQAKAVTRHVEKAAGSYTAVAADYNQFWRCTGAVTINLTAAATLASGWCLHVRANGGAVTIDPDGAETIDGSSTLSVPDGNTTTIVCTGSAFFSIGNPDVQPSSANLDAWSALATSAKQDASANLTTLAGITPGAAGQAILADATVENVRDYLGNFNAQTEAEAATIDSTVDVINVGGLLYERITATSSCLGPELVTNGVFLTDTDWTKGTGWTIGSGVATHASGTASSLSQAVATDLAAYLFQYTRTLGGGATITPSITGSTLHAGTVTTTAGTFTTIIENLDDANTLIAISCGATYSGTIDNVSVKRLPPEAFQSADGTWWGPGGLRRTFTGEPAANIDTFFGALWRSVNQMHSESEDVNEGHSHFTTSIIRLWDGNNPTTGGGTKADGALFVEARNPDFLTSEAYGQTVAMYLNVVGGRRDNHSAQQVGAAKVFDGTYDGSVSAYEFRTYRYDASQTTIQRGAGLIGWAMSNVGTNYSPDDMSLFTAEVDLGDVHTAFVAVEDSAASEGFQQIFAGSLSRNNANTFFRVTGSAHTSGIPGLVHASGSSTATWPAYSFTDDTDTGIGSGGADQLIFYTGGVTRMILTNTLMTVSNSIHLRNGTAIAAGGTAGVGLLMSTTSNFGVFYGSGAPTLSAAQGSLYLRSDGSSTSTRLYVNTNGTTGWTNVTTAA